MKPPLLELTEEQAAQPTDIWIGSCTRMIHNEALSELLAHRYGRDGLCLKALREPGNMWEGTLLYDVSRVQNIGAIYGVAPRVYDIVSMPDGALAQVTDWSPVNGEPSPAAIEQLMRIIRECEIGTKKIVNVNGEPKWDIVTSICNWAGDLFLDWGGYYLTNPQGYIAQMRRWAHAIAYDLSTIILQLQQCDIRRVITVEHVELVSLMREMANWLGYWNVEVVGPR